MLSVAVVGVFTNNDNVGQRIHRNFIGENTNKGECSMVNNQVKNVAILDLGYCVLNIDC